MHHLSRVNYYPTGCNNPVSEQKYLCKRKKSAKHVTSSTANIYISQNNIHLFVRGAIGLWQQSFQEHNNSKSSDTNMARNNLQRHPESINSDQEKGRRRSSCHNCCSRAEYTTNDNSGIRGGEAGRSGGGKGSATQQHPNWCGTNRVRIGNIAATYLFIGLLLLQSSYLCQGTYLLPTIVIQPQPPSWSPRSLLCATVPMKQKSILGFP